ncbi:MAG: hypothetical protein ACRD6X_05630 [Pyrinomonadaceae bacterium]
MKENELQNASEFETEWKASSAKLSRIEAPPFFEANVRARIERGKQSNGKAFSILKLAIPVSALAAMAIFFYVSGFMSGDVEQISVIQESRIAEEDQPNGTDLKPNDFAAADPSVPENKKPLIAETRSNETNSKNKIVTAHDKATNESESVDLAVKPSKPGILPKGLDPDSRTQTNARGIDQRSTVRVADVIQYAGVHGEFGPKGMTVFSVAENSPAKRVGIMPGDVIEAVNDTIFTSTATIPGGSDLSTGRVFRNGTRLTLRF